MSLDWSCIRCFLEVAEQQSFTSAAKFLKISIATATRRLDSLEQQLGFKLLNRGPTGVELTENGAIIFELSKSGGEFLFQLERVGQSLTKNNRNAPIQISGIETVISEILAPKLPALIDAHPGLVVELITSHGNNDPDKNETDIAISLDRPHQDSLVTRLISRADTGLFCSADYLADRSPLAIDLTQERFLGYGNQFGEIPEVLWLQERGLDSNVAMLTNSTHALLSATQMGLGVAILPAFLGRSRGLVRIPVKPEIPSRDLWMVLHSKVRSVNNIRIVKEWIIRSCISTFDA